MKRGKTQKEQGTVTEHSALLHHNARALANQSVCYIPLIYYNTDSETITF